MLTIGTLLFNLFISKVGHSLKHLFHLEEALTACEALVLPLAKISTCSVLLSSNELLKPLQLSIHVRAGSGASKRDPGILQSDHSSIVQTFKPLIKCTGCRHELSKPEESLARAKVGYVRSARERGSFDARQEPSGVMNFSAPDPWGYEESTGVRKQVVADICSAWRPLPVPPPTPPTDTLLDCQQM